MIEKIKALPNAAVATMACLVLPFAVAAYIGAMCLAVGILARIWFWMVAAL